MSRFVPPSPLAFAHRPSTLASMARAVLPHFLRGPLPFPPLAARWDYGALCEETLERLAAFTGLARSSTLSVLCPHVLGFPLVMVLVTHPSLPLPIWRALQVRNRLVLRRPISTAAALRFEARVGETRVLEKGAEVDLQTAVTADGAPSWESEVTFFYRGRFAGAGRPLLRSAAPQVAGDEVARWTTPSRGGWLGGRLTGDYNGIHLFDGYARLMGFPQALHHPPAVLGRCLDRLGPPPVTHLEAWLKGPVPYCSEVTLRRERAGATTAFALSVEGDARPAIVGRLGPALP